MENKKRDLCRRTPTWEREKKRKHKKKSNNTRKGREKGKKE